MAINLAVIGSCAEQGGGVVPPELPPVIELTIINPGAEEPLSVGWTSEAGAVTQRTSPTHSGDYTFFGGTVSFSKSYQDIDISTYSGPVDERRVTASFSAYASTWSGDADYGELTIRFLDSGDNQVGSERLSVQSSISDPEWEVIAITEPVPVGCRKIRIAMQMTRISGTENSAYFDDLELRLLIETGVDFNMTESPYAPPPEAAVDFDMTEGPYAPPEAD